MGAVAVVIVSSKEGIDVDPFVDFEVANTTAGQSL